MLTSHSNWVLRDFRTFVGDSTGAALIFRAITGLRLIASEPDTIEMVHARKVLNRIEGLGK